MGSIRDLDSAFLDDLASAIGDAVACNLALRGDRIELERPHRRIFAALDADAARRRLIGVIKKTPHRAVTISGSTLVVTMSERDGRDLLHHIIELETPLRALS